jgi:hypothetical protein
MNPDSRVTRLSGYLYLHPLIRQDDGPHRREHVGVDQGHPFEDSAVSRGGCVDNVQSEPLRSEDGEDRRGWGLGLEAISFCACNSNL